MRRISIALALLLAGVSASAQTTSSNPKTTLLMAARLLDVRNGKLVENAAVLIEGDKIKEVGGASSVRAHAPKDATVINLGNATLIPGLIDCHAHLLTSGTTIYP